MTEEKEKEEGEDEEVHCFLTGSRNLPEPEIGRRK